VLTAGDRHGASWADLGDLAALHAGELRVAVGDGQLVVVLLVAVVDQDLRRRGRCVCPDVDCGGEGEAAFLLLEQHELAGGRLRRRRGDERDGNRSACAQRSRETPVCG
jgi:hypothetical protein